MTPRACGTRSSVKKEVRFCRACDSWMIEGRKSDHVKSVQHKVKARQAADAEKDAAVAVVYKKLQPLVDLPADVRAKIEKKKVQPLVEIPVDVRAKFEKKQKVEKKQIVKKRQTDSFPKTGGRRKKIVGNRSAPK